MGGQDYKCTSVRMRLYCALAQWYFVFLMVATAEGALTTEELLNLESIQISNALLKEFQGIDEVRIVEVPQSSLHSLMRGSGGHGTVQTFSGTVYRKPVKHFVSSNPHSVVQESNRKPIVRTSDRDQMMFVNLGAILGMPQLGVAQVPLKILNNQQYEGRKWVAVPSPQVQTKDKGAKLPPVIRVTSIPKSNTNSIYSKPASSHLIHLRGSMQKHSTSSSSGDSMKGPRSAAERGPAKDLQSNMPVNANHRPQGHLQNPQRGVERTHPHLLSHSKDLLPRPHPGSHHSASSQPIPASVRPPKDFHPYPPLQGATLPQTMGNRMPLPLPAKVPRTSMPWMSIGKPLGSDDFMHMPTLMAQPIRRTPKTLIRQLFGSSQDNIVITADHNEQFFQDEVPLAPASSALSPVMARFPLMTPERGLLQPGMPNRELRGDATDSTDRRRRYHSYFG